MTEKVQSRLWIVDLAMKGGALGVAIAGLCVLCWATVVLYGDIQKDKDTLIAITREQNGGLISYAAAVKDLTEVLADLKRSQDVTNRLIETLLLERRTGSIRPASLVHSPE